MKKAQYPELSEKYENHIDNPCDMELNRVFISENAQKPEGLCDSAWESMEHFVTELAKGNGNFFGNWMKNPKSAMISCNDGFRPVSFLLETIE